MDKKQKEIIAAVALVVIAIVAFLLAAGKIMRSSPRRGGGAPKIDAKLPPLSETVSGGTELSKSGAASSQGAVQKEKVAIYNVEDMPWGRDPFVFDRAFIFTPGTGQTRAAKEEQLASLKLAGIIISTDKPQDSIAVINGENLKVGEKIGGFILRDIKTNSVTLEWENEEFTLPLWSEETQREGPPVQP